jgi:hypothetical protein
MQAAFGVVIWVVCGIAAVVAIVALVLSNRTWEEFGKSGLVMDSEAPRASGAAAAAANSERDAEIRQMLAARNARRARHGEAPIDIEQELARLTAPAIDPALRQEIRDLVIARNMRRVRAGKPPLDVDAELEREIARLSAL